MNQKINLKTIEDKLTKILKPIPNMPEKAQKWVATNIWWMAAILTGLIALGVIATIIGIFQSLSLISSVNSVGVSLLGDNFRVINSGSNAIWISRQSLSLIFSVFSAVVYGMAIIPLKESKKRGWDLLFLVIIVNGAWTIIQSIIGFNFLTFIPTLFFGAIFFLAVVYLLIQIKSYFVKKDK